MFSNFLYFFRDIGNAQLYADISDSVKNGLHQVRLEESSTSERMDLCKLSFLTLRWWAILMISVLEKLMFLLYDVLGMYWL